MYAQSFIYSKHIYLLAEILTINYNIYAAVHRETIPTSVSGCLWHH